MCNVFHCVAGWELTRAELVFQSLKQLAGFSVPVFYAPEWVMERKRGWRGKEREECVWMCGGGRVSGREGPFASHQLRMSLAGPRSAAEGAVGVFD